MPNPETARQALAAAAEALEGVTPGEWRIEKTGDGKRIVVGKGLVEGPNGYDVAEVYSDDCDPDEAMANAKLFAYARQGVPTLAAELEAALERERVLREALMFYAAPQVYKPHPHGPAFDRRDLSFHAKAALDDMPSDGTCVRCGAVPRNASGLCATCVDEDALLAGDRP